MRQPGRPARIASGIVAIATATAVSTATALTATTTGATALQPAAVAEGPVAVSLVFDDGLTSQYKLAPTFRDHGVRATFYLNSGALDTRGGAGTMSWEWVRELATAGHEIGGHTVDHAAITGRRLTFRQKWRQVCDDRARLIAQGFHVNTFAYVEGALDDRAKAIVRGCGYQSARKAGSLWPGGPYRAETVPPIFGPYEIQVLGVRHNGPMSLESLQAAVTAAYTHGGGWLPILFHRVCHPGTDTYDKCMNSYRPVDATVVKKFLSWADSQPGITFRTVSEVLNSGVLTPRVRVTRPVTGATVKVGRPKLSGTAQGSGAVRVRIYRGAYSVGKPLRVLGTKAVRGQWKAMPGKPLRNGTYTVQASQSSDGVTGTSVPVTIRVRRG